jgi:cell division protein FtsQ
MSAYATSTSLPLKLTAWAIALGLVALPVVGVMNGWFASDRWPFRQLKVDAEFQRINAEQVRAAVAPHIGVGFFAVNLDDVRESLEALPWIETVQVRKRWPDLLEIALVERRPVAVWGDARLVSESGALFEVPGEAAPEGMPRLVGPDARVADVLEFWRNTDKWLDGSGLSVAGVTLSGRGSWSLDLSSGAQLVIGREAPEARLARFIEMLPRLEAPVNAYWAKADLRYANGFALEWRENAIPMIDGGSPEPGEPAPAGVTPDAAPATQPPEQSPLDQMLEQLPETDDSTPPNDNAAAQA